MLRIECPRLPISGVCSTEVTVALGLTRGRQTAGRTHRGAQLGLLPRSTCHYPTDPAPPRTRPGQPRGRCLAGRTPRCRRPGSDARRPPASPWSVHPADGRGAVWLATPDRHRGPRQLRHFLVIDPKMWRWGPPPAESDPSRDVGSGVDAVFGLWRSLAGSPRWEEGHQPGRVAWAPSRPSRRSCNRRGSYTGSGAATGCSTGSPAAASCGPPRASGAGVRCTSRPSAGSPASSAASSSATSSTATVPRWFVGAWTACQPRSLTHRGAPWTNPSSRSGPYQQDRRSSSVSCEVAGLRCAALGRRTTTLRP